MKAQQALAFVENALDGLNRETLEGAAASLAAEVRRLRDEVNGLTGSLDRAESVLQNLMSYLSVNGCRTEIDPENAELRIRDGIDMLVRPVLERAERAEAELKAAREQEPIKYLYRVTDCFGHDVLRDDPKGATILETIPLYAAPVPALAVPAEWREVMAELAADLQECIEAEHAYRDQYSFVMRKYQNDMRIVERARALLQSGGGK